MSLLSTLSAYQGPLLILAAVFLPGLLPRFLALVNPRYRPPQLAPSPPRAPMSKVTIAIIALHTIYCLYHLFQPPYDVFRSHNFPILVPNDILRTKVLRYSQNVYSNSHLDAGYNDVRSPSSLNSDGTVNPLLDLLLNRLTTLEPRFLYSRFGHRPLLTCVWCNTKEDFFLASLPGIIGGYLGQAFILGVLGWEWIGGEVATRRASRWRVSFGWVLGIVMIFEMGLRYFWEFEVDQGDCLHLSPMIHTYRQILFILLPIIYLLLPLPIRSPLPKLIPHLQNTLSTLRLLSTAHTAITRSSRLRTIAGGNGQLHGELNRIGRESEDVRKAAAGLGLFGGAGSAIGDVRVQARGWVREGWKGMIRIDDGSQGGIDGQLQQ